jgi:hypothetical protein
MSSAQMYFTNQQVLEQSCSSYGFLYKWHALMSGTISGKKRKKHTRKITCSWTDVRHSLTVDRLFFISGSLC